jgi:hypothetical protein
MLTYLIRGYLLTLLLAPLLLFTFLVYAPGGAYDTMFKLLNDPTYCDRCLRGEYALVLIKDFKLNKPWPFSYFAWLWDPEANGTFTFDEVTGQWAPKGIDVFGIRVSGSGVITGDLGYSLIVEGVSVQDLIIAVRGALMPGMLTIFLAHHAVLLSE